MRGPSPAGHAPLRQVALNSLIVSAANAGTLVQFLRKWAEEGREIGPVNIATSLQRTAHPHELPPVVVEYLAAQASSSAESFDAGTLCQSIAGLRDRPDSPSVRALLSALLPAFSADAGADAELLAPAITGLRRLVGTPVGAEATAALNTLLNSGPPLTPRGAAACLQALSGHEDTREVRAVLAALRRGVEGFSDLAGEDLVSAVQALRDHHSSETRPIMAALAAAVRRPVPVSVGARACVGLQDQRASPEADALLQALMLRPAEREAVIDAPSVSALLYGLRSMPESGVAATVLWSVVPLRPVGTLSDRELGAAVNGLQRRPHADVLIRLLTRLVDGSGIGSAAALWPQRCSVSACRRTQRRCGSCWGRCWRA
eukprot:TRINITY_DN21408_c0_g1_i1.p2 TRINITY_DN21408_c0_g1~~TRINITY_DN21408_c0_g1_i1.p2  ORF type:complete len:387 (+),score=114.58 TRINITY_DN21408_c0_g1_i1:41-1162(+)